MKDWALLKKQKKKKHETTEVRIAMEVETTSLASRLYPLSPFNRVQPEPFFTFPLRSALRSKKPWALAASSYRSFYRLLPNPHSSPPPSLLSAHSMKNFLQQPSDSTLHRLPLFSLVANSNPEQYATALKPVSTIEPLSYLQVFALL